LNSNTFELCVLIYTHTDTDTYITEQEVP